MYSPYIKQEEPLKTECQHFIDCISSGTTPVSCGVRGTELVRILEASSESLKHGGGAVEFVALHNGHIEGNGLGTKFLSTAPILGGNGNGHSNGNGNGNGNGFRSAGKKRAAQNGNKNSEIKIALAGK